MAPGGVETIWLRGRRRKARNPRTAIPAETMRIGKAAKARLSAEVWHSSTNADHWARAVGLAAVGSGPAPMVTGSKKAMMAASEP
jgi:hypothetical protein